MKKAAVTFLLMLFVSYVGSLIGHNIFKSYEFTFLFTVSVASAVIVYFNDKDGK